jgi:hypothetical protein
MLITKEFQQGIKAPTNHILTMFPLSFVLPEEITVQSKQFANRKHHLNR